MTRSRARGWKRYLQSRPDGQGLSWRSCRDPNRITSDPGRWRGVNLKKFSSTYSLKLAINIPVDPLSGPGRPLRRRRAGPVSGGPPRGRGAPACYTAGFFRGKREGCLRGVEAAAERFGKTRVSRAGRGSRAARGLTIRNLECFSKDVSGARLTRPIADRVGSRSFLTGPISIAQQNNHVW